MEVEQEEAGRFNELVATAWAEINAYGEQEHDDREHDSDDPVYRYASAFFEMYLARPLDPEADQALMQSFSMWNMVQDGAEQVGKALQRLGDDENALARVIPMVWFTFAANQGSLDAEAMVESLLNRIHSPYVYSDALYSLARNWMQSGDTTRARPVCERIIAAGASDWHIKQAQGILHELSDLNVGQMAPVFKATDIDGQPFDLAALRGSTVFIDFWATWCAPCRGEFPHLRRVHELYKNKPFVMVSITLDEDCDAARKMIAAEKLSWRHICQGGWDSPLASLYNVLGIPRTILIGPDGRIASKGLRDTDIGPAVARLVEPAERAGQVEAR